MLDTLYWSRMEGERTWPAGENANVSSIYGRKIIEGVFTVDVHQ